MIKIGSNITKVHSDSFLGSKITVICPEFSEKPDGWAEDWNSGSAPVVWAFHSIVVDDYFDYGITGGKAYITAYKGLSPIVVIPEEIDGAPVVSVCAAFSENTKLTHIVLPDSLEEIGDYAFESCSRLVNLTIPDNVTSIGSYAFYRCDSLLSATIPDSITSIGDRAFSYCRSLTTIIIPDSVISLGRYAFEYCDSLTNILVDEANTAYQSIDGNLYSKDGKTLIQYAIGKEDTSLIVPEGVTYIGDYAFYYCKSLVNLTIPDSVTSIGSEAFYWCQSLANLTIPDSVTSIGSEAFENCRSLTSVTFGKNSQLQSIGDSAFSLCQSLTSIIFGENSQLQSIGDSAFYNCRSLTSITVPDSVISIGNYAFSGCSKLYIFLESIQSDVQLAENWNPDNRPVYSGALMYESSADFYFEISGITATIVKYIGHGGNVLIPDVVTIGGRTYLITKIAEEAFAGVQNVQSVVIGANVQSIGTAAFSGCTLSALYVAENNEHFKAEQGFLLTKDGKELICALSYLSGEISIPDGVHIVHTKAFEGCGAITSVSIPASVQTIASLAFFNTKGLTEIKVDAQNTSYASVDGILHSKDLSTVYCYPSAKEGIYYTALDSVTYVESYCFDNAYLKLIFIPNANATLRDYSFIDGQKIVSKFADDLYRGEAYKISDAVAILEENGLLFVLRSSKKATVIACVDGTENASIPGTVYKDDVAYTVTEIAKYAFYNCDTLISVTVPDSVISIGSHAFYYCRSLTSVNFGENSQLQSIGRSAFTGCFSLTNITIPDSVTSIGNSAFANCTSLVNVFYGGTAEDWNAVSVESNNQPLLDATLYFYSEEAPTEEGNHWHYGEDGEILIWE